MIADDFNKLLAGPLHHPLIPFKILRLTTALFEVVNATGDAGEKALLEVCLHYQARDDRNDSDLFDSGEV